MNPNPEFRKQRFLERIELPELAGFGGPAHDGPEERADEGGNPSELEFVVHVGSLDCFGVEVREGFFTGINDEGGEAMP